MVRPLVSVVCLASAVYACSDDAETDLCDNDDSGSVIVGCPDDPETDLCDNVDSGVVHGCPDDPESDLCDIDSTTSTTTSTTTKTAAPTTTAATEEELEEENADGAVRGGTWFAMSLALAGGFGGRGLVFSSLLAMGDAASAPTTCKDMKDNYGAQQCCGQPTQEVPLQIVPQPSLENNKIVTSNPCQGKNPNWPNKPCFVDDVVNQIAEQAGGDVTDGFVGQFDTDIVPIQQPYFKGAAGDLAMGPLCPVNVHWHLGAEHRSEGQYDENGRSPLLAGTPNQPYTAPPAPRRLANASRQLGSEVRYGFACHHYDAHDPKFTTPYNWQHCLDMHVGETYEVHWPSSVLGACGTPYQYQSKFYDGVFCRYDSDAHAGLTPQQIASAVGVQSQVFTIVNDETYYYPNLMRGMIVNDDGDGDFGKDLGIYTGSSTGTSRDNAVCSAYSPITWQVDRKCHLISASTFDKMCADMKQNFDDMSMDLHPHGARSLVDPKLNADNLVDQNHQTR